MITIFAIVDNFLRKNSVFLENQCNDQFFEQYSFVLSQQRLFVADFLAKIFKKITTPVSAWPKFCVR
jgi:hypothetical protein